MAAMLLAIGIGLTMAPAPAITLLTGLAVNAALLAAAVAIGAWAAPQCALTSLIVRATPITSATWRALSRYAIAGLVLGAAIAGVDAIFFTTVPSPASLLETHVEIVGSATVATPGTVVVRMVYGGIIAEILARWCLLALLAWSLLKSGVRRPPAIGFAIVVSALLFGSRGRVLPGGGGRCLPAKAHHGAGRSVS